MLTGQGPGGLGQRGGRPQTQGFLCLHTNATAAASVGAGWGPDTRRQVADQTCALLRRHEGATCRAAGALPEPASTSEREPGAGRGPQRT